MARLIVGPVRVPGVGEKKIDEYIGHASSKTEDLSIAHMRSPAGWTEPGQRPEFDEYTVVLGGAVRVETEGEAFDVEAGQAIIVSAGEWVRYSTPRGAEYIAVCAPAFSMATVRRDPS